ncbi:MAG: LOG family protein [Anaerolineaceae bacterium]|nr:LOG family protein [Anaerolineaceae bacterium]MDD4043188.1 LOG family protein [Anaerolineaceae bacterium]MDD4578416.1 LOG family protein [Anaerolineaceae bacterium]
MIVSVFGSAAPTPEQTSYQEALELGRLLGENGFTVMTGGYCGTMEAVSRGANEASGNVIGITCRQIEDFRPTGPNAWVRQVQATDLLSERIEVLTSKADAYIALPGGIGTLAEIAVVFNKMAISSIPSQVLILIGEGWKQTFEAFFSGQAENVSTRVRQIPQFAKDPQDAVRLLVKSLQEMKNG